MTNGGRERDDVGAARQVDVARSTQQIECGRPADRPPEQGLRTWHCFEGSRCAARRIGAAVPWSTDRCCREMPSAMVSCRQQRRDRDSSERRRCSSPSADSSDISNAARSWPSVRAPVPWRIGGSAWLAAARGVARRRPAGCDTRRHPAWNTSATPPRNGRRKPSGTRAIGRRVARGRAPSPHAEDGGAVELADCPTATRPTPISTSAMTRPAASMSCARRPTRISPTRW